MRRRENSENKEIKEREVKLIEEADLDTGKRLDLVLLALDRKKVAFLGNHEIVEGKKNKEEIIEEFTEELKKIESLLKKLDYPYSIENNINDEVISGFSVSISKNNTYLSEFIKADKDKDDKKMGFLLGYPPSAVEAYNSDRAFGKNITFEGFIKKKLSPQEIDNLRTGKTLEFINFQPSKEHWREELEYVKENQKLVRNNSPNLYEEIIKNEEKFS